MKLLETEVKRQGLWKKNSTDGDVDNWYDSRQLLFDNHEALHGYRCKRLEGIDSKSWMNIHQYVLMGKHVLHLGDGIILLRKKCAGADETIMTNAAAEVKRFREQKGDGGIPLT